MTAHCSAVDSSMRVNVCAMRQAYASRPRPIRAAPSEQRRARRGRTAGRRARASPRGAQLGVGAAPRRTGSAPSRPVRRLGVPRPDVEVRLGDRRRRRARRRSWPGSRRPRRRARTRGRSARARAATSDDGDVGVRRRAGRRAARAPSAYQSASASAASRSIASGASGAQRGRRRVHRRARRAACRRTRPRRASVVSSCRRVSCPAVRARARSPSTRTRSPSPNTGVPNPRGVGRSPMCVVGVEVRRRDDTCSASACSASRVAANDGGQRVEHRVRAEPREDARELERLVALDAVAGAFDHDRPRASGLRRCSSATSSSSTTGERLPRTSSERNLDAPDRVPEVVEAGHDAGRRHLRRCRAAAGRSASATDRRAPRSRCAGCRAAATTRVRVGLNATVRSRISSNDLEVLGPVDELRDRRRLLAVHARRHVDEHERAHEIGRAVGERERGEPAERHADDDRRVGRERAHRLLDRDRVVGRPVHVVVAVRRVPVAGEVDARRADGRARARPCPRCARSARRRGAARARARRAPHAAR